MRRRIAAVLLVLLAIASTSCFESETAYCDRLDAIARDEVIQDELRVWVADNLADKTVATDEVLAGDLVGPGFRWLGKSFDAERLRFGAKAHVRLVGPEAQDVLDGAITEKVRSVLFTERSRTGIIVRSPSSSSFGVAEEHLRRIAPDIAVLCWLDE